MHTNVLLATHPRVFMPGTKKSRLARRSLTRRFASASPSAGRWIPEPALEKSTAFCGGVYIPGAGPQQAERSGDRPDSAQRSGAGEPKAVK
jgi:hypothetical protein